MPTISFSHKGLRGELWRLVADKEKNQTIRPVGKREIKVGDQLIFYWKQRVPRSKKLVHRFGTGICTKVSIVKYAKFAKSLSMARKDGFADVKEMQAFFGSIEENGEIKLRIIEWGDTFKPDPTIIDLACPVCKRYNCVVGKLLENTVRS